MARCSFLSKAGSCLLYASIILSAATIFDHGPLRVSSNGRYLEHSDGTPFFYLGDTGWLLFMKLDQTKAEQYLANRAAQGYNVVMASLWVFQDQNTFGEQVFSGGDQSTPNDAYFSHVEWIVDKAAEKGLYVAINPAWSNGGLGGKIQSFSESQGRDYGQYLGNRFKAKTNVIWFVGGDGTENNQATEEILAGIRAAGDTHLATWHPSDGETTLSLYPNSNPLLDFNMYQTGHASLDIQPDYAREMWNSSPAKPSLNGEPNYEDIPIGWHYSNGYFNDFDTRKQAYWSVFSGACGHVYGHHAVWMFYEGTMPHSFFDNMPIKDDIYWTEAMNRPGSTHMQYVRNLMESRPFISRIPDQSLIVSGNGTGGNLVTGTRDMNGSYAIVYIPRSGHTLEIDMAKMSGSDIAAWWYDPRTGQSVSAGTFAANGTQQFTTPADGPDWVLVLDDTSARYPSPGSGATQNLLPQMRTRVHHAPRTLYRVADSRILRRDPQKPGIVEQYTITGKKLDTPRKTSTNGAAFAPRGIYIQRSSE